MSDNKLKIRIHIQQPKTSDQPNKVEAAEQAMPDYDAHDILEPPPFDWRKITFAAVLLITVIGLISYLIFGQSTPQTETDTIQSEADHINDPILPSNDISDNTNKFAATELTDIVTTTDITQTNPAEPVVDVVSTEDTVETEIADTIIPTLKPNTGQSSPLPSIKPEHAQTNPSDSVQHDATTTPSSASPAHVVRAQLTHAIRRREPVDDINTIQLKDDKSASIYFFVELHGLAGQLVTVSWYRNDQLTAETHLQVSGQNWRTYASKQLNQKSIGSWRVVLSDEAGTQMTEKSFIVSHDAPHAEPL